LFQPQHFTIPLEARAHACCAPTETDATPDESPAGVTGTELEVNEPSPSWPSEPDPQQRTPPAVVRAHEKVPPTETDRTPDPRPVTDTGVRLLDVPFPGDSPQHLRPPEVVTAQLRPPPADTAATFDDNPDTPMGESVDTVEPVPSSP
jgi:hypothetical protein